MAQRFRARHLLAPVGALLAAALVASPQAAAVADPEPVTQDELVPYLGHEEREQQAAPQQQAHAPQYRLVVARHSGKCLDIAGASTDNAARAIQFTCSGSSNQRWALIPTKDGFYHIVARHSGQCLEVARRSTDNGARVQQWPCSSAPHHQWRRVDLHNGYSKFVNRNSHKCLDVNGASQANGTRVVQWSCTGGTNQQWRLV
ncbi:hypothetical protein HNP84_002539 [Thermocatellispora tengchongensis]|uniref:Ricin B lectin domain-containing protein n=1 Tax=Thermocatellispora tengchongensis TaxID=1073253 RepID=A0A840NZA0_9ACTN|nr:RICIN domain-containing protein [Thermocatellispora tengchongensis]MBB5132818.1 hypothetical protein [Thermocatellispora tengchongensis]